MTVDKNNCGLFVPFLKSRHSLHSLSHLIYLYRKEERGGVTATKDEGGQPHGNMYDHWLHMFSLFLIYLHNGYAQYHLKKP